MPAAEDKSRQGWVGTPSRCTTGLDGLCLDQRKSIGQKSKQPHVLVLAREWRSGTKSYVQYAFVLNEDPCGPYTLALLLFSERILNFVSDYRIDGRNVCKMAAANGAANDTVRRSPNHLPKIPASWALNVTDGRILSSLCLLSSPQWSVIIQPINVEFQRHFLD